MDVLTAILASVVAVSLIAFIGVIFIGLKESLLKRVLRALVGFSSGTLLGGAFLHLLPEAIREDTTQIVTFYYVILGIVVFLH